MKCDILPPVQYNFTGDMEYEIETSSCLRTAVGEICLQIRLNRAA